jgi:hypothetical protein
VGSLPWDSDSELITFALRAIGLLRRYLRGELTSADLERHEPVLVGPVPSRRSGQASRSFWCPQRDSNPCYRLERPVIRADWTVAGVRGRREKVLDWLQRPASTLVRPTNRSTSENRARPLLSEAVGARWPGAQSALGVVVACVRVGVANVVRDHLLEGVQPLVELVRWHGFLGFWRPDDPWCRFESGVPRRVVGVPAGAGREVAGRGLAGSWIPSR